MKFFMKLPGGGEITFEREPMSQERFNAIWWLIVFFLFGSGVLKFMAMVT